MAYKFKEGDEVKVIGNATGLNQIGMKFTVAGYHQNPAYIRVVENNWNFLIADLKLLPLSKEDLLDRANAAKREWQLLQDKADYLEESGQEKLKESEFQKYQLKKILESENLPLETKVERIHMIFVEED